MALSLPLLLTLLFVSIEMGNYVYSEHRLVESVRDGARFAARTDLANFPCAGSTNATLVTNTQKVVRTGTVSGTTDLLPKYDDNAAFINVTHSCTTSVTPDTTTGATVTIGGIYKTSPTGAPVVNIDASVPYRSILGALTGSTILSLTLRAEQEALVIGF